jgi:hypothetical protein
LQNIKISKNILILNLVIFFTVISFTFATLVSAQDLPKADFFKNNYVNKALAEELKSRDLNKQDNNRTANSIVGEKTINDSTSIKSRESAIDSSADANVNVSSVNSIADSSTKQQVENFGVIINCLDSQKCLAQIENYIAAVKKYKLPSGYVYLLGASDFQVPENLKVEIDVRGGRIDYLFKLPAKYQMLQSLPAWIIGLQAGEVLVEGQSDLSVLVSGAGEYIGRN